MRIFWPLYLIQVLVLLVASVNTAYNSLNPDFYANTLFSIDQTLLATHNMWADIISHAFYLELNRSFPLTTYNNSTTEWDVPTWFSYPQGGTIAECNGIGCTLWNLSDAGSPTYATNPCPTVLSYTPVPDPLARVQSTEVNGVAYYAIIDANKGEKALTSALQTMLAGTVSIVPRKIEGIPEPYGYEVNGTADISIQVPVDVTLIKNDKTFFRMRAYVEYRQVSGYCVCTNIVTHQDVNLATYELNRAVIHIITDNPNTKYIATNRSTTYVQWFINGTLLSTTAPPSQYTNCRIVIG